VDVDPDRAWALVGGRDLVPRWYPVYVSSVTEGDTRTLTREDGVTLTERLLERDEAGRSYAYAVVAGLPLAHHRAAFRVTPRPGGGCTVTWSTEARHEDPAVDMRERLAGRQREALLTMKRVLEEG
jgi:hypothetical protein